MDQFRCGFLQLLLVTYVASTSSKLNPAITGTDVLQEICDTEEFRASCQSDEVVLLLSAKYGRMQMGRCVTLFLGYIGCHKDVLTLADSRCSGRQSCRIRVPDAAFERTQPCLKELKTFLEISYMCVQVATILDADCDMENQMNLTSLGGYISSSITWPPECRRTTTLWSVQASRGQKINVTLYDFNVSNRPIAYAGRYTVCTEYGHLYDDVSQHTVTICGSGQRQSHVYTSTGNLLNVRILAEMSSPPPFLIHYEVLGCADLSAPLYGWFKRISDQRAVVGCLHSDHSWRLACDNRRWQGFVGNCTATHTGEREGKPEYGKSGLSAGIAIAIVLGAAFAVGLIIIIFGLLRYTRGRPPLERHDHRETIALELVETRDDTAPAPPRCQHPSVACRPATYEGRKQHVRVIKINGNEYEHIWESPLPRPSSSTIFVKTAACKKPAPPSYTAVSGKNKPHYVTSADIYRADTGRPHYRAGPVYSLLDTNNMNPFESSR